MRKVKRFMRKIAEFLSDTYKREEYLLDALCLLLGVSIFTFLPSMYAKMELLPMRVVVTLLLLVISCGAVLFLIRRLVKRSPLSGYAKANKKRMLIGALVVLCMVWLGSRIVVSVVHPSLSGVYSMGMTRREENLVTILNSIFFVFNSQVLITLCTGARLSNREFLQGLGRAILFSFLPIISLTCVSVFLINTACVKSAVGRDVLNLFMTVFLWVTCIALNEKIFRDKNWGINNKGETIHHDEIQVEL